MQRAGTFAARLFVLCDQPAHAAALRRQLEGVDAEWCEVPDWPRALAAADEGTPSLVIIRLENPRFDGLEALRRLRATPRTAHVPIILISESRVGVAERQRETTLGSVVFVYQNDVDYSLLRQRVATLIALQREAVAVQQHIHRFLDSHARLAEEHPDYAALSPAINRHLLVDRLTGLPNHMFFELHLSALLRRSGRSGRGFALLWMDVDHLQRLNHRLGRAAGDHLLTTLAGRIESGVRSSDVLARIGGDTFGMLLDGVGDETAVTAALQKVLAPVGETLEFPAGGESIRVSPSFSVGAALFPRHAETQSGLYAAARLAAEAVRGSGGNGLRVG